MKHEERYVWFDLLRGLSALAVCASHLRSAILVDFPKIQSATLFQKLLYSITALGHESVIVFFVLSGFFVGGSILKAGQKFTFERYAITRLTRLWVVLIPALIVTMIVDLILSSYSPNVLKGLFYSLWNSGPAPTGEYSLSWLTFLGNVVFLQTIKVPVFGTNSPLWSLAYEFWYYVLFPLCMIVLGVVYGGKDRGVLPKLVCASVIFILVLFLPNEILRGYIIWLFGVAVFLCAGRLNVKSANIITVMGMVLFLCSLVYSKSSFLKGHLGLPVNETIGFSFAVLSIGLVNLKKNFVSFEFVATLSRVLSEFSYSLYLVHFPFVAMIASLCYGTNKLLPNVGGIMQLIGWLLVLICLGVIFWWLFERRTNGVRAYVSNRIESLKKNRFSIL